MSIVSASVGVQSEESKFPAFTIRRALCADCPGWSVIVEASTVRSRSAAAPICVSPWRNETPGYPRSVQVCEPELVNTRYG